MRSSASAFKAHAPTEQESRERLRKASAINLPLQQLFPKCPVLAEAYAACEDTCASNPTTIFLLDQPYNAFYMVKAKIRCDLNDFMAHNSLLVLYYNKVSMRKSPMFNCLGAVDSKVRDLFESIEFPIPQRIIGEKLYIVSMYFFIFCVVLPRR